VTKAAEMAKVSVKGGARARNHTLYYTDNCFLLDYWMEPNSLRFHKIFGKTESVLRHKDVNLDSVYACREACNLMTT